MGASKQTANRGSTRWETSEENVTDKTKQRCHFCRRPCSSDDFCRGCGVYVCLKCDSSPSVPFGEHAPEAHSAVYYYNGLTEEYGDY